MDIKKLIIILIASGVGLLLCAGTLVASTFLSTPSVTQSIEASPTQAVTEVPATGSLATDSPTPTYYPDDEPVTPTPDPTASNATPKPTIQWPAIQNTSIVPSTLLLTGYDEPASQPPSSYNMNYYLEVDLNNQCVNVFVKNPTTGKYDVLLNRFVCSAGAASTPTPTGTFTIKGPESTTYLRYAWFPKWWSWAQYATRITGPYLFHSFTYHDKNTEASGRSGGINLKDPKMTAYNNLGNPGSAGCVRLLVPHAKWIYTNCALGTMVNINKSHAVDKQLKYVLKPPPYGTDLVPDYHVATMPPATVKPTATIKPAATPVPTVKPTARPTASPAPTATPTLAPTPTPTPTTTPTPLP